MNEEVARKERFLTDLRGHMKSTQELTEKQLKALKDESNKERANTQMKLSNDRDRIQAENELYLEQLNDRYRSQTRRINEDGQNQITDMERTMKQQYSDTVSHHQKKINDQTNEFTTRFKKENDEQKRLKDESDSRFKKERLIANEKQQIELSTQADTHLKTYENRDGEFRKGLKEQDLFFEKKYEVHLKNLSENLKNLDDRNEKIVQSMKNTVAEDVTRIAERADDPFFQFSELRPELTKFPDRVEVRVKVPSHSKQDLQMTLNNKEVVLNYNRRFTETNKSAEGFMNKVNKVETYTSRLNTDMILNPKTAKSSYENGVMTYTIMKA